MKKLKMETPSNKQNDWVYAKSDVIKSTAESQEKLHEEHDDFHSHVKAYKNVAGAVSQRPE